MAAMATQPPNSGRPRGLTLGRRGQFPALASFGAVGARVGFALGLTFVGLACESEPPSPPAPVVAETSASPPPEKTVKHAATLFDNPWDIPEDAVGPGRWVIPRSEAASDYTPEQLETIRRLESIGYLSGSREQDASGVVFFDESSVAAGWNLYTSGHAPEAILMTMSGEVLHRWKRRASEIWSRPGIEEHPGASFWRRVHLLEDGSLLAVFEGLGLVKLDKHSNVLWSSLANEHHDLAITEDGTIFTLARAARLVPWIDPKNPVLEDFVVELSPQGEVRRRISVLKSLKDSPLASRINPSQFLGDVLHTNTIVVLGDEAASIHEDFEAGQVLLAFNNLRTIAVLDLEAARVVWFWEGSFPGGQHDAEPLADGSLLMFHNGTRSSGSRVVALQAADQAESVVYENSREAPFYSLSCGAVQRFANGNTLVTESDGGRAFELAPSGEVVWEFFNPHRAGPEGEYVATLFEVERIAPESTASWLGVP